MHESSRSTLIILRASFLSVRYPPLPHFQGRSVPQHQAHKKGWFPNLASTRNVQWFWNDWRSYWFDWFSIEKPQLLWPVPSCLHVAQCAQHWSARCDSHYTCAPVPSMHYIALLWFLSKGGAGTLPIVGYTGRFHPKGVLFISLRYTKGQGNILKGRRGMVVDYWYFGINCYQIQ